MEYDNAYDVFGDSLQLGIFEHTEPESHVNQGAKEADTETEIEMENEGNIGTKCDFKRFWDIGTTCECCHEGVSDDKWADGLPDLQEQEESSAKAKRAEERYAFILRYIMPRIHGEETTDGRRNWKFKSIDIQSPFLKTVLRDILSGLPEASQISDRAVSFESPFEAFFFRWDEFSTRLKSEKDEETNRHIELLADNLQRELGSAFAARAQINMDGTASFQYLWTIFPPGEIVLNCKARNITAARLAQSSRRLQYSSCIDLSAQILDWNGDNVGWKAIEIQIPEHEGLRKVTELPYYPLTFHGSAEIVREQLVKKRKEI